MDQEDEDRLSIVKDILRKCTDFLRRVILPFERHGVVTYLVVCMPSLPPISALKTTSGGSVLDTERSNAGVCGVRRPM